MFLRSITLKGFKSFPERTRLEFGPGVSVVVGPNGSGKSNITDAVLWALGEQSPVAVRGQSMQDVIFAGAPGRKASGAAEVELVLDDSGGSLGLGVPEVSIVRRLDRTGDGEYRLAGARCRLVDVIEAVSDTGLGKEMHSVISQGRVESIVTSKPRDRRLLIEEAAGLGKHRKRRRRAQLKLARTQDNLDRALDVEREARSRLRPLKRQAEAAELHARLERQALEVRWELTRDALREQLAVLQHAEADATQARARRERVEQELAAVAARREAAEEALAARSAQREELSRRCFAARSAGERVGLRAEAVRAAAEAIDARHRHGRRLIETLTAEVAAEPEDAGGAEQIASLESRLAELERDREQELAAQLESLEGQLAAANGELRAREEAVERARSARAQAIEHVEQARAEVHHAERAVEAARQQAAGVGAELAAANQFLRAHAARTGGASVLADDLEVDPGYELALAAALDGRLSAAVVPDRGSADALLDSVGEEGGRALIAGDAAASSASQLHPPGPNAEPIAERVRGPAKALALARALLADTWVVESFESLPPGFGGVAVTRSGRVWAAAAREVRQAPALGEERVLAERNRRERLIRESQSAASAELAARAAVERAGGEYRSAEADRERAATEHRARTLERDEAAEEVRRIESSIARRRAAPDDGPKEALRRQLIYDLASKRTEIERMALQRAQRESQLTRLKERSQSDEALRPVVVALAAALQTAQEGIRIKHAEFEAALAADREAGEHVAAELRACAREEASLQSTLHGSSEALTEAEVRLERSRDRATECGQELAQIAERLGLEAEAAAEELPPQEREALTARLERLMRRRELLGPVNPLAEQEYVEALEHAEELERQRTDLETAIRELERLIADTDRQIRETFEQTFAAAARNFEDVAAQLFPGGRGRLRLVAENDRPARVLGDQPPPPAEGEGDPAEIEPEVEDEQSEEDLLGVEIEINPAGKEMKRLSLLSGGEKSMTALAFLFAVFLARPCPFYILDEVEAALDDLNIDRFLGLLRSYSNQAQFIVVTHQRRTMEAADFLYGVSMGGDGISKVISRRLPREEAAA